MLVPATSLFAPQNLNIPEAYPVLISETNIVSCSEVPCPLFKKVNQFIRSERFPFLQAVLERVELTQDDLSLKTIYLIQNNNSTLDDEIVYRAFVKHKGYGSRLFSSETWEEWTENRTPLGRVVSNFLEYAFQGEGQKAKLINRSERWLERANKEAQQLLNNLQRPLMEKIELLRKPFCYDRAKDAELAGCDTPEMEALVSGAVPRAFKPHTIRLNMHKDCCVVKMGQVNAKAHKITLLSEKETGITCTAETQLVTVLSFHRYGDSPMAKCKIPPEEKTHRKYLDFN